MKRLQGDFNGLFGDLLCLSHEDSCRDEDGDTVMLKSGMIVTVFDIDEGESGERDDIIASGVVEPSPDWLQCKGLRWVLRIDARGVCHESDLKHDKS
jgi:hypothetical protein